MSEFSVDTKELFEAVEDAVFLDPYNGSRERQ